MLAINTYIKSVCVCSRSSLTMQKKKIKASLVNRELRQGEEEGEGGGKGGSGREGNRRIEEEGRKERETKVRHKD